MLAQRVGIHLILADPWSKEWGQPQVRGRAFDNIFIERLWRSVKYEDLYIKEYPTVPALEHGLHDYFQLYNYERPHQSLAYRTPADVYCAIQGVR